MTKLEESILKSRCGNCSNHTFELTTRNFTPRVKNVEVEVTAQCYVCNECGMPDMDNNQMNVFRRAAADTYRENNNLYTSQQIIQFRENLGLSQQLFAEYLGVGQASVKRWETYYVQDVSQNQLIQIKCDIEHAKSNFYFLQYKKNKPNIDFGHTPFSPNSFKEIYNFYKNHTDNSQENLPSFYFYCDFIHFKENEKSICGLSYAALRSGPEPKCFSLLVQSMHTKNCFFWNHRCEISRKLDDTGWQVVRSVCDFCNKNGTECLRKSACKENGYLSTQGFENISYKHAKSVQLNI